MDLLTAPATIARRDCHRCAIERQLMRQPSADEASTARDNYGPPPPRPTLRYPPEPRPIEVLGTNIERPEAGRVRAHAVAFVSPSAWR